MSPAKPLQTESPADARRTADSAGAERLAALRGYKILDTPAEQGFDDIVLLASQICRTPVALVSLIDHDRQWFKARIGTDLSESPLEYSICTHAILEPDLLVIPDLTQDARTRANPLVSGEPHIRFYAGAPLRTPDGHVLGTLCVIDHTPRPHGLSPPQAAALRALANRVMAQLELRRTLQDRDQALAMEQQAQRRLRSSADRFEAVVAAQDIIAAAEGDLGIILNAVCTASLQAVEAAEGSVVELREGDELVYRAAAGSLGEHLGVRLPLHSSLSGRCMIEGRSTIVDDAALDPAADLALVQRLDLRSLILVPVPHRGEFIGILKLVSSRRNAFTDRDAKLAQLLAGAAAAGLSSAGDRESRKRVWDSEARYRAVFDSAVDFAIVVLDLAGTITNWNTGATRIFGWTTDEMLGQSAERFFTPEDRAAEIPAREMRTALAEGRGIDERWHLRKDGSRFWANGELMPLRAEDGTAIGFIKILRDRTAQRQAEEDLRESERQLRLDRGLLQAIFQQAPVGISVTQASGQGEMRNAMLDSMLGHLTGPDGRPDDLHANALNADGRPYGAEDYPTLRALGHGDLVHNEPISFRSPGSGETRRLEVSSAPVYGDANEIVAAVTIVADVEPQRRAAEALRQSEERLALAFEASGSLGWWDWSIPDDRVYTSALFAEICGVDPSAAAAGLPHSLFLDSIHPDDRGWVGKRVDDAIAGAAEFSEEYRLRQRDGTTSWLYARGRCFHDTDGKPSRFSGVSLDITARKLAERYQAAVVELSDRLRDPDDTAELAQMAAELIGRTLDIDRAGYGTVDLADETLVIERDWCVSGLRSLAGAHRFRDYGSFIDALKRGETVAITDAEKDPQTASTAAAFDRIGVRALVNVPVIERKQTVALLYLHSGMPRAWSEQEVAFARDVAVRTRTAIERVRAEERQHILNHELSHRLKNNLAMVQAIVAQTLRNSTTIEGAREALLNRLAALGRAHDILLAGGTDSANVATVVTGALDLHDDNRGRFRIDGPGLLVGPSAALSLSLMLHELATNAMKYGALSNPKGFVAIAWSVRPVDGVETFGLTWSEHHGPPVTEPLRKGFGSRLIERGFGGGFGGAVVLRYEPAGVVCTMTATLKGFQASE